MKSGEVEAILEAVLFVAPDPVSLDALEELFPEGDRKVVKPALASLGERYAADSAIRGVVLEQVAGGYRLVTKPQFNEYLETFFQARVRTRLSMPALETLTIVAYRQPITGPEIQELRGVNSGAVLKTLIERGLIRVAGRKQVVGKPFLYRTSKLFLEQFGLASIKDLPPLEEFEESFGALEAGSSDTRDLVAEIRGDRPGEDPQAVLIVDGDDDVSEPESEEAGEEPTSS